MKRKFLAAVLTAVLVLSLMPMAASADQPAQTTPVKYLDATGAEKQAECIKLNDGWTTWDANGWYYSEGNVTINDTVTMEGDVNLVLADQTRLTISGATVGITDGGNGYTLNIFAQSTGANVGALEVYGAPGAEGVDAYAGISCKTINVYGGRNMAEGGDGGHSGVSEGCLNGADGTAGAAGVIADVNIYNGEFFALGGNGGGAEDGQDGAAAEQPANTAIAGGNGGDGAVGGVAVQGAVVINGGAFYGTGGDGTDGAAGGKGGDGYAGAYDSQYAAPTDYTCGEGGGNGGNGADSVPVIDGTLTVNKGIAALLSGLSGKGGKGGNGGNATGFSGTAGTAGEGGAGGAGGTFENPTGMGGTVGQSGDTTTVGDGGAGGNGGNAGTVEGVMSTAPVVAEGATFQTKRIGVDMITPTYSAADIAKYDYILITVSDQEEPLVPAGDNQTTSIWLLLLALSVFGVGATLVFKKKSI